MYVGNHPSPCYSSTFAINALIKTQNVLLSALLPVDSTLYYDRYRIVWLVAILAKLFTSVLNLELGISVDADEIRRLGKRFRKLDLDNSGALSIDEFMSLPELQQNPLVQRVIDIFDADGNGEVSFNGFVLIFWPNLGHHLFIR